VTSHVALTAGFGASTMLGQSASARAPKLGAQSPYFYRFAFGGVAHKLREPQSARDRSAALRRQSNAVRRRGAYA
jgi:hypothetical protein